MRSLSMATAVCLLFAAGGSAQEPGGPSQPPEKIGHLIEQLDADEYAIREAASQQLTELGNAAKPAVEAAQKHPSAEVRYRIAVIQERMKIEPLRRLRQELAEFAARPDAELDVEQGMFLLSRILDEQVKKEDLARQLDEIALKVRGQLGKDTNPAKADPKLAVDALRHVLFTDCGFRGNEEDYTNPNNCSLAKILETKKGRPVFISHLMIAVARRLEIPIVGLPVTGMYIVKYDGSRAPAGFPKEDIFIHPYERGRILTREDRQKDYPGYDPDIMVAPGTSREVIERMLNNASNTLASRDQPGDNLRRQLLSELEQLLAQTPPEDPAPDAVPVRGFRIRALRAIPLGDY